MWNKVSGHLNLTPVHRVLEGVQVTLELCAACSVFTCLPLGLVETGSSDKCGNVLFETFFEIKIERIRRNFNKCYLILGLTNH